MGRRVATRGGLLALAAFAVGIWLGVTAGLATRAKHGPAGPVPTGAAPPPPG